MSVERRSFAIPLVAVLASSAGVDLPLAAQQRQTPAIQGPYLVEPVTPFVFDRDVRTLPIADRWRPGQPFREVEDLKERPAGSGEEPTGTSAAAPVPESGSAADTAGSQGGVGASAAGGTLASFDGIPATAWVPPDTVGDVGPNHYVQMVNIAFAIYDKQGSLLAGPSPINSLWTGFGGPCETSNNGDPVVRYDHLADRWLMSQFALPAGNLSECIAVSRTADPVAGGWYLYQFPSVDQATMTQVFPDYPKLGVWPDAYYMSTQRSFFVGTGDVWAFDRANMLNGAPAGAVQFAVGSPSETIFLLPSDLDGPPPPLGTPNFFVRQVDAERFGPPGTQDRLEVFAFGVDWASPALSTFAQLPSLPTAPFDSVLCVAGLIGQCIPQPGTANLLESLTVWPMWRLQYRNFGTHETMVVNHTIDVNSADQAGLRWYELRRPPSGVWSIFQQGTHSPDASHRWMASLAMNGNRSMALGYNVSSSTVFPGLRAAGRLETDAPGTLAQGEMTLVDGGGSQTGSARWGNYSSMDVDPVDDCTFWFTGEYYPASTAAGWRTRISAFQLADCAGPGAPPPPPPLRHQAGLFVGGLLTEGSQPLNSGIDFGFRYRRLRFLPSWSWEYEVGLVDTESPVDAGLLASLQGHIVRHLAGPSAKVQGFVVGGLGVAHFNSLGFSDTGALATLGLGADYQWTRAVGFRLDVRLLGLDDVLTSGWTVNGQALWSAVFSF